MRYTSDNMILDNMSKEIRERDETIARLNDEVAQLRETLKTSTEQRDAPEIHDFLRGVVLEADHQVARWGSEHDAGKSHADWFWLLGYLAGKALHAAANDDMDKAMHHTISSAAALLNWHRALSGNPTLMRPGIADPEEHDDERNDNID